MRKLPVSLAVAALSLSGVLYGATGASATSTTTTTTAPSVSVTPSTGLTNGEAVSVSGSGFVAGDSVYIIECYAAATNQSGCDTNTATAVTIDSSGNLPTTSFTVSTGQIGSNGNGGTCGTSASDVGNCVIAVANITGADRGVALISFATPTSTTTTTTPGKKKPKPKKHVPRRIQVHPRAGLHNNQKVRVTGRGFKAGEHFLVECLAGAKSQNQCDTASAMPVTVKNNGRFRVIYQVHTGKIGNGYCGTKPNNRNRCQLSVAQADGKDAAKARIHFRK